MKTPKKPSRREVALGLAAASSVPASAAEVAIKRVNPPGILTPRGYTHVVSVTGGRTVYISGQISANAKGEVVGKGDIKAQTTQVFESLKVALAAAGASPKDVVKITFFAWSTSRRKTSPPSGEFAMLSSRTSSRPPARSSASPPSPAPTG